MRRARRKNKLNSEMNIVPYVDVMFVLLTIFMVTATTISVGIDVDVPEAKTSQSVAIEGDEMMVISVKKNGDFSFNQADDPSEALSDAAITQIGTNVFNKQPKISTLVKGDKNAPYGRVIDAVALLQNITGTNVQLMTAPLED